MDFGSISGRSSKSSSNIKRKGLLGAFSRKSTQPPPTAYNPPTSAASSSQSYSHSHTQSTSSSSFSHNVPPGQPMGLGFDEPESPYPDSLSSHSHSHGPHALPGSASEYGAAGFAPAPAPRSGGSGMGGGSWRHAREGSMRSQMGYTYPESMVSTVGPSGTSGSGSGSASASIHTAAPPSSYGQSGGASIARTFSNAGTAAASASGPGDRPRERAPSGKYSLGEKDKDKEKDKDAGTGTRGAIVRRPEDLVKVVKDRMFSWSYMMTWYQGDSHWFNTVKIPPSATESYLGAKQLETRARNYYVLGMSLSMLFDISGAPEFLRALVRLLEEWESMAEGGGNKVKSLFRGQKGSRKPSGSGEYHSLVRNDGEAYLYDASLPFQLDFFQVHATVCSIIRDIYKKILGAFLPSKPPSSAWTIPPPDPLSVVHPSTIIHSAPLDAPFSPPLPSGISHHRSTSISSTLPNSGTSIPSGNAPTSSQTESLRSPSQRSTSSLSHTHPLRPGVPRRASSGTTHTQPFAGVGGGKMDLGQGEMQGSDAEYDAFQMYILGALPPDRTLVGDGQGMGKEVVELFAKADGKLRKHFSILLRETDTLARRVLDAEIASVLGSFDVGSQALQFDVGAAMSPTAGNGHSARPRAIA